MRAHNINRSFKINNIEVVLVLEEDVEDDCTKLWHYFQNKEGAIIKIMDWSPYAIPTEADIELYIELGCPERGEIPTIGPLNRKDLDLLKVRQQMELTTNATDVKLTSKVKLG